MDFNFEQIKADYIATLNKFKDFDGRARRKEFWTFAACNFAAGIVLYILGSICGLGPTISTLAGLAILAVSFAVGVRRLHDTGRNGKLMLLLVPSWIAKLCSWMFWISTPKNFYETLIFYGGRTSGMVFWGTLTSLFAFIGIICVIPLIYWMCLEGTKGDNQYGPDPKAGIPPAA